MSGDLQPLDRIGVYVYLRDMFIAVTTAPNVRPIIVRVTSTDDIAKAKEIAKRTVAKNYNHITRLAVADPRNYGLDRMYAKVIEE